MSTCKDCIHFKVCAVKGKHANYKVNNGNHILISYETPVKCKRYTVYDYTGNVIAKYKGRIDVQVNESKVLFDMDGKRYIYYNAVVEVIEK